jgi:hypothetical protein
MAPVRGGLFRRRRTGRNSTTAAVIADVVVRCIVNYGFIVNIVHARHVDVIHRAVIVERSVIPISALVADAAIAEAIVDAAVKPYIFTPVTAMPGVHVISPTPITRSPEKANLGSHHPGSRNPEVTFISIRPVAGRPYITIAGSHWLHVHRQSWRSQCDRHANLRERDGRYGQYQNCEQQQTNDTHFESPCPIILRLPVSALLLRAAWSERRRVKYEDPTDAQVTLCDIAHFLNVLTRVIS